MSKRTYELVFDRESGARAAEDMLRQHGDVSVRKHEDDHDRLFHLTLVIDGVPPSPYEIDRIALRCGGRLEAVD